MRLLVVGAGATGGYFGGRLAQGGRDVTFLVRAARAAALRERGLEIVSPNGDAVVRPGVVTKEEIGGAYDAVLLTVKAFSLEAAMEDMAGAVGPSTMIMPVLNGMRHVEVLGARFGARAVVGGVCKVAASLDAEGRVVQLNRMQELSYGELGGAASERTAALDAFMQGGGFAARLTGAIDQELWEKWVLLATIGGLTCLMGVAVGGIEAAGGAGVAVGFLAEAAAVAGAAGFMPSAKFLESTRGAITTKGSPLNTSMFRDMQAGLAVEAGQIVGDMVERARGFGVAVPLLEAAFVRLRIYEQARERGLG